MQQPTSRKPTLVLRDGTVYPLRPGDEAMLRELEYDPHLDGPRIDNTSRLLKIMATLASVLTFLAMLGFLVWCGIETTAQAPAVDQFTETSR